MSELSKYFTSETIEIQRSEINLADYNPRSISAETRKKLKHNIKKNGLLGGLVYNLRTKTLVSGHQRISVLDELNLYPDNDYMVKVEAIDVDEQREKELNVWFNNTSVQGQWDYDMLAQIIPDIDYKNAGLTDEDLQLIGIDFTLQTEEEQSITDDINNLIAPVQNQKEAVKQAKKELSQAEKIAHNKEVKAQVMQDAQEKAENMESYVMISFDSYKAKAAFMERFGFDKREKFVKGELFENMIERID